MEMLKMYVCVHSPPRKVSSFGGEIYVTHFSHSLTFLLPLPLIFVLDHEKMFLWVIFLLSVFILP